jgi:transmembrane sensor
MAARKSKPFKRLRKINLFVEPDHFAVLCYLSVPMRRIVHAVSTALRQFAGVALLSLAPSLVLIFGPLLLPQARPAGIPYSTKMGEHRSLTLPDGSTIDLNTSTNIVVYDSAQVRLIRLLHGEALFKVHHEERPFFVDSGAIIVRDIATRFDVYAQPAATRVTVLEGRVQVELRRVPTSASVDGALVDTAAARLGEKILQLSTAQQLEISNDPTTSFEPASRLSDAELACRFAWLEGAVQFHNTPLLEATVEMGRYNAVQFRFADPALAKRPIGGRLGVTQIDDFEDFLRSTLQIGSRTAVGPEGALTITLFDLKPRRRPLQR